VVFGNRIVTLGDVILSETRRESKTTLNGAESKDPEGVYATTPWKGILNGGEARNLLY
jgi:hypothetical protein